MTVLPFFELIRIVLIAGSLMIVTAAAFAGYGALITRRHEADFGALILIGLVPITTLGLVLNFFVPLGHEVALAAISGGLVLSLVQRRRIVNALGQNLRVTLPILGLVLLAIVISALMIGQAYDTGLYHLQTIQWIENWPRVFGLANVHSRLGFNNALFTTIAMTDLPGTGRKTVFLLNHVLTFAALAMMTLAGLRSAQQGLPVRASNAFGLVIAALYLGNPVPFIAASPSSDSPPALMSALACWSFLRLFEAEAARRSAEARLALLLLLVCSACAVAIKLSAAPFALLPLGALGYLLAKKTPRLKTLVQEPAVVCLAVFVAAWLAAGLSSSGCLLFPFPASCVPHLSWGMPIKDVKVLANVIKAWARLPGEGWHSAIEGWAWLKTWPGIGVAAALTTGRIAVLCLAVAAVAVGLDRWAGLKPPRRSPLEGMALGYLLLTVLAAALFWFLTAPDLRFAMGILAALPGLLLAALLWRFSAQYGLARFLLDGRTTPVVILMLALAAMPFYGRHAISAAGGWAVIPATRTAPISLGPGFEGIQPRNPDGSINEQCWDEPAPCVGTTQKPITWKRVWLWRSIEVAPHAP